MRKTKIICTIGPSCCDEATVTEMVKAGMNVARFNFSHGTHEQHGEWINTVKKVREKLGCPVGIMLDTKGPEYRIGTFENGEITLKDGDTFSFTVEDIEGTQSRVSVSYKNLINELSVGDTVLLNNGLVVLTVKELTETDVVCVVEEGGALSNRKSMSFPGKVLRQAYMSDQDKSDILFGIKMDVDFIACSFVSCRKDVMAVRSLLNKNGGEDINIIAKIENRSGVDKINEIMKSCDGIMVARGDLGVEIPFEELPAIQKQLITTCRLRGKRVITATEMLESMTKNPRPTRAEISDVANAVYDGTSAIMLSGETAMGKYPVESVKAMSRIAERTESNIDYTKIFSDTEFEIKDTSDAVSHATCALSIDIDAKAIVVCTRSGRTARMVSRFRSPKPIIGLTTNRKAWNQLALSWAVIPAMSEEFQSIDVLLYYATTVVRKLGYVEDGDKVVITAGVINGKSGNTDLIKLETI